MAARGSSVSAEAARMVPDGATLGVGGALFTRVPLALVQAVAATGVRDLTYVAWGGGLPLELLLQAGAVRKVVFCFSSLDLFGLAPRFRAALEQGTIEADELNALALSQALEAAGQRLPSLPLQVPRGSDILARTRIARRPPIPLGGEQVVSARRCRSTSCWCTRSGPTRTATSSSPARSRSTRR